MLLRDLLAEVFMCTLRITPQPVPMGVEDIRLFLVVTFFSALSISTRMGFSTR